MIFERHQNELEHRIHLACVRLNAAECKIQLMEAKIHALLNSRSWRLTAPLRFVFSLARKQKHRCVIKLTALQQFIIIKTNIFIKKYPAAAKYVLLIKKVCALFPCIKINKPVALQNNFPKAFSSHFLGQRANDIYHLLKIATEEKKDSN